MAVRWILLGTIFLVFVEDANAVYAQWLAPFAWAHDLLMEALPWKVRLFDHITLLCLILARRDAAARGAYVPPMRNAVLLAGATTIASFIYGMARGGGAWEAGWQIYLILSGLLLSWSVATVFRTPQHYVLLAKVLLVAAAYRAVMCWSFYALYIHTMLIRPPPELLTSHDDTVLWVGAMLLLVLLIFQSSHFMTQMKAFLFLLFLAGAVLLNQRRLAWLSLAAGGLVVLLLMPPGKYKRRTQRLLWISAPIVLTYVVAGWGRTERIFRPLRSFATVATDEDASTLARNVENLGLIATSNTSSFLAGTGWGHPYIEISSKYSIARFFPLWQYIPHNSILGLLAYTGALGFCGYWLAYSTAMFLNARLARLAKNPLARDIGILAAANLVVCANQFYGDMGIYYPKAVYLLSMSYGVAMRLPIFAEVWPPAKGARPKIRTGSPTQRVGG